MKVQFGICFRCAQRMEAFSEARADALKMQSYANPRTCSKTRVQRGLCRVYRTHRRTCSSGCGTQSRSWPGRKDAGLLQEPEAFRAHGIETGTDSQACLRW